MRAIRLAALVAGLAAARAGAQAPATPPQPQQLPVTANAVVRHLRRTISWYRRLSTIEQSSSLADNDFARTRLDRTSMAAVQYAFTFARAAAKLESTAPKAAGAPLADSSDDAARLDRAATRLTARVTTLQSRIAELDAQIAHAPARQQDSLGAQRNETAAALELAQEVQKTILQLQQFAASSAARGNAANATLAGRIDALQRTIPEARVGGSAAAAGAASSKPDSAATAAESAPRFRPQSAGLVALTTQWFALRSTNQQLQSALQQTEDLSNEIDTLRVAVSRQVRGFVRTTFTDSTPASPQQLVASQHQLEDAATRFKQLSTLLVPLGEQDITVDDAQGVLSEWSDVYTSRATAVLRNLLLRALVLIASIVLVLVISEVWRRATFRYLHDARRRRQFLVLRRVVVAIALLLIIVLGFVSELGSLATYVGFLTAGLAVALQNVILAIVAYFFLIGRYGVRIGDRITLAGVTGRVIDIGLVRIYLMELAGPELQSTGRIVVLSNAVLFQPAALFKQIPGAEYVWHTLTLTVAPQTNVSEMQARLKEAADSVYKTYQTTIDQQHAAVQRMVDFDTSRPEPQVDVRFTEQALEFVVRYPVLPEQAATNDQLMLRALRDVVGDRAATIDGATPSAARS